MSYSLGMLAKMDRFKHKLATVPQAPRPVTETDAIGALLDICVQRSWPLAKYYFIHLFGATFSILVCTSLQRCDFIFVVFSNRFTELQACGQPHAPEFTILCQLAHIKCTGRASTKKGAKQNAAQEMLTFVQNVSLNEDQMQITSVEAEPAERTFRTYRELKNSDIKPKSVRIRNRHNYFLRLPDEDRRAAYRLLKSNSATIGTNKDIVDLVCKALKLRYEIKDIPGHIENNKIFVLLDDFDCVISEKEPILYDRIINYFRTMMV